MTIADWLAEARRTAGAIIEQARDGRIMDRQERLIQIYSWACGLAMALDALPAVVAEHDLAQRREWLRKVEEKLG